MQSMVWKQRKIIQVLKIIHEQQKKKRGISNQQVCCLFCADTNNNHFLQSVCVGRIQPIHIQKTLVPHFTEDTVLVTDSHRAYRTVANKYKIPLNQIPSGKHTAVDFIWSISTITTTTSVILCICITV